MAAHKISGLVDSKVQFAAHNREYDKLLLVVGSALSLFRAAWITLFSIVGVQAVLTPHGATCGDCKSSLLTARGRYFMPSYVGQDVYWQLSENLVFSAVQLLALVLLYFSNRWYAEKRTYVIAVLRLMEPMRIVVNFLAHPLAKPWGMFGGANFYWGLLPLLWRSIVFLVPLQSHLVISSVDHACLLWVVTSLCWEDLTFVAMRRLLAANMIVGGGAVAVVRCLHSRLPWHMTLEPSYHSHRQQHHEGKVQDASTSLLNDCLFREKEAGASSKSSPSQLGGLSCYDRFKRDEEEFASVEPALDAVEGASCSSVQQATLHWNNDPWTDVGLQSLCAWPKPGSMLEHASMVDSTPALLPAEAQRSKVADGIDACHLMPPSDCDKAALLECSKATSNDGLTFKHEEIVEACDAVNMANPILNKRAELDEPQLYGVGVQQVPLMELLSGQPTQLLQNPQPLQVVNGTVETALAAPSISSHVFEHKSGQCNSFPQETCRLALGNMRLQAKADTSNLVGHDVHCGKVDDALAAEDWDCVGAADLEACAKLLQGCPSFDPHTPASAIAATPSRLDPSVAAGPVAGFSWLVANFKQQQVSGAPGASMGGPVEPSLGAPIGSAASSLFGASLGGATSPTTNTPFFGASLGSAISPSANATSSGASEDTAPASSNASVIFNTNPPSLCFLQGKDALLPVLGDVNSMSLSLSVGVQPLSSTTFTLPDASAAMSHGPSSMALRALGNVGVVARASLPSTSSAMPVCNTGVAAVPKLLSALGAMPLCDSASKSSKTIAFTEMTAGECVATALDTPLPAPSQLFATRLSPVTKDHCDTSVLSVNMAMGKDTSARAAKDETEAVLRVLKAGPRSGSGTGRLVQSSASITNLLARASNAVKVRPYVQQDKVQLLKDVSNRNLCPPSQRHDASTPIRNSVLGLKATAAFALLTDENRSSDTPLRVRRTLQASPCSPKAPNNKTTEPLTLSACPSTTTTTASPFVDAAKRPSIHSEPLAQAVTSPRLVGQPALHSEPLAKAPSAPRRSAQSALQRRPSHPPWPNTSQQPGRSNRRVSSGRQSRSSFDLLQRSTPGPSFCALALMPHWRAGRNGNANVPVLGNANGCSLGNAIGNVLGDMSTNVLGNATSNIPDTVYSNRTGDASWNMLAKGSGRVLGDVDVNTLNTASSTSQGKVGCGNLHGRTDELSLLKVESPPRSSGSFVPQCLLVGSAGDAQPQLSRPSLVPAPAAPDSNGLPASLRRDDSDMLDAAVRIAQLLPISEKPEPGSASGRRVRTSLDDGVLQQWMRQLRERKRGGSGSLLYDSPLETSYATVQMHNTLPKGTTTLTKLTSFSQQCLQNLPSSCSLCWLRTTCVYTQGQIILLAHHSKYQQPQHACANHFSLPSLRQGGLPSSVPALRCMSPSRNFPAAVPPPQAAAWTPTAPTPPVQASTLASRAPPTTSQAPRPACAYPSVPTCIIPASSTSAAVQASSTSVLNHQDTSVTSSERYCKGPQMAHTSALSHTSGLLLALHNCLGSAAQDSKVTSQTGTMPWEAALVSQPCSVQPTLLPAYNLSWPVVASLPQPAGKAWYLPVPSLPSPSSSFSSSCTSPHLSACLFQCTGSSGSESDHSGVHSKHDRPSAPCTQAQDSTARDIPSPRGTSVWVWPPAVPAGRAAVLEIGVCAENKEGVTLSTASQQQALAEPGGCFGASGWDEQLGKAMDGPSYLRVVLTGNGTVLVDVELMLDANRRTCKVGVPALRSGTHVDVMVMPAGRGPICVFGCTPLLVLPDQASCDEITDLYHSMAQEYARASAPLGCATHPCQSKENLSSTPAATCLPTAGDILAGLHSAPCTHPDPVKDLNPAASKNPVLVNMTKPSVVQPSSPHIATQPVPACSVSPAASPPTPSATAVVPVTSPRGLLDCKHVWANHFVGLLHDLAGLMSPTMGASGNVDQPRVLARVDLPQLERLTEPLLDLLCERRMWQVLRVLLRQMRANAPAVLYGLGFHPDGLLPMEPLARGECLGVEDLHA